MFLNTPAAEDMSAQVWTDRQFDAMSWHDNHVHAIRFVEGKHGAGELVLDLDYIVEWICDGPRCTFRIVPAQLTFREVSGLRMSLDYATPGAAFGPFSIDAIRRREEPRERYVARVWTIVLNWPAGEIRFEATGFEQRAAGLPVLSEMQCLQARQREPHD